MSDVIAQLPASKHWVRLASKRDVANCCAVGLLQHLLAHVVAAVLSAPWVLGNVLYDARKGGDCSPGLYNTQALIVPRGLLPPPLLVMDG
jgi:hypothetical protein